MCGTYCSSSGTAARHRCSRSSMVSVGNWWCAVPSSSASVGAPRRRPRPAGRTRRRSRRRPRRRTDRPRRTGRGCWPRHVPALGGVGRERGDHAERVGLAVRRSSRRSRAAWPRADCRPRQHPVELDVGVDAGGDAAEDLEDRRLLEHHAGVALLGADHPRRRVQRQLGVGLLLEAHAAIGARPTVDQRQQVLGGRRVVERVVAGALAVGADGRDRRCTRRSARCPSAPSPGSAPRCRRCRRRRAAPGRGRRAAGSTRRLGRFASSRLRPAYQRCWGSHSANGRSRRIISFSVSGLRAAGTSRTHGRAG